MFNKDKVVELLAKHDPMGFIKLGAPPDEYTLEAEDLCLLTNNSLEKVKESLCDTFTHGLGGVNIGSADQFTELAKELLEQAWES